MPRRTSAIARQHLGVHRALPGHFLGDLGAQRIAVGGEQLFTFMEQTERLADDLVEREPRLP